jgi:hypothetical protein
MDLKNKLFLKFLETQGGGGGGAEKRPYGQRLTPAQRRYARSKWHVFVAVRQVLGTCIACNRKHRPGEQRCTVHRNINRAKCKAWSHENRDQRLADYREARKKGVCANNADHGPVFEGHSTCRRCYMQARRHRRVWVRENAEHILKVNRDRREELKAQGLCIVAAKHGPAMEGRTHCQKCVRAARRYAVKRARDEREARIRSGARYFAPDGRPLS